MRWGGERESSNVEDRRGGGGGGGRMPVGGRGIGLGTIAIALVAGWIFGINPLTILGIIGGGEPEIAQQAPEPPAGRPAPSGQPAQDERSRFVSVVLASTEDAWGEIFRRGQAQYQPPRLVLFTGRTNTACGLGDAAAGPFYCPGDRRLYIDLRFFDLLRERFRASGDMAEAYVIAHEVGHHVQNLLGTMDKVQAARARMSQQQYNQLSVRLELQADCYAGIWAHHSQQAKNWLEAGDIEEALGAASAVGDDNIQRQTQGVVVPESFTHGSAAQRTRWFKTGFQSGDLRQCDTFAAR